MAQTVEAPAPGAAPNAASNTADLRTMRHSAAHVMAEAVQQKFPTAQFGIGPAIEDGFYYDFLLPRTLTPDDLEDIEKRMKQIIKANVPFERHELDRDGALTVFGERNQPFKVELIEDITSGAKHGTDDEAADSPDAAGIQGSRVSLYKQGGFEDLCGGPHVARTGNIGPFKLLRIAGAYWRGNEKRPQLQRIYGTAWPTQEALDHYLWVRAEAEKRDHRRLGRELELFHLDPTAPGMPYWLPKGFKALTLLIDFWRVEHEKRGYQEVSMPLLNDRSLYERSGHWDHYQDNMFTVKVDEHITYGVKPMNCPNAMVIYNLKTRSYRDLPLRFSDVDVLHRNERSGTLQGLFRVQHIQQDDAHIFVAEGQVEEEYDRILEIVGLFYDVFGLKYHFRMGTRPADFLGDVETWNKAEGALRRILDKHVGPGGYQVQDGDGAFYGPKIDILMEDAIGRPWQMGTIQLDFQLPRRFDCEYIDQDGQRKTPVVIHRVIYGSLERFMGILIEHYAGAFPVWLSPVQAIVLPIADRHNDYATQVRATLAEAGVRTEVDTRSERVNAKIRDAQLQKIPYMLVVGDREMEAQAAAVRLRTGENLGALPVAGVTQRILQETKERR